jgi:hypothetical protein
MGEFISHSSLTGPANAPVKISFGDFTCEVHIVGMPSSSPKFALGLQHSLALRASKADERAEAIHHAVISIAATISSADVTLVKITDRLNADEVLSQRGKPLTPTTVIRALERTGRTMRGIRGDRKMAEFVETESRLEQERLADAALVEAGRVRNETLDKRQHNRNRRLDRQRDFQLAIEDVILTDEDGQEVDGISYMRRKREAKKPKR